MAGKYEVLQFKEYGDERGNLVVAEGSGMDIPFDIKRVFYMYGSDPDITRGEHANRETEFVLINVSGSSKVLVDDGLDDDELFFLEKRLVVFFHAALFSSTKTPGCNR